MDSKLSKAILLFIGIGLLWLLNSRFFESWFLESRFAGVALRILIFCWGLVLGIVGICGLVAAFLCLRTNASLLVDAFYAFFELALLAGIGLFALYGAYRCCLLAVRDENRDD